MKRTAILLIVFALLSQLFTGASAVSLEKGDRGEGVKEMQQRLIEMGLLTGDADGNYGGATQAAVEKFQAYLYEQNVADIAVTGVADEVTLAYLNTVDYNPYERDLTIGEEGDEVALLQSRLASLMYLDGKADGVFGAKTETAVKLFQSIHKDFGLTETGVADRETFAVLFSANAIHADSVILRALDDEDEGPAVERLQTWLRQYGFSCEDVDGIYGKKTTQAVKLCQQHLKSLGYDVSVSGKASVATLTPLSEGYQSYVQDLTRDDAGSEVERVQARLYVLGYMDVQPTGTFGEYTAAALSDFQRDSGLGATGKADRTTQQALFSADATSALRITRRQLSGGDQGETVRELQEKLLQYGFMSGVSSGRYDNKTVDAIARLEEHLAHFGETLGLESAKTIAPEQQLRILDDPIEAYVADVQSGDKGGEVYRVQRRLHTLYYIASGLVDGKAGKKLTAAIESFQKNNGLEITGVADEATQKLLFSEDAVDGGTHYLLKISIPEQRVYAYERDAGGNYSLVREMICSTGLPGTPTPTGIFLNTWPQHRWHYFTEFECWAQYTFVINGNILFHSVLYSSASESSLRYSSLYALGRQASHGCVRLNVPDAKWIFENCVKGTVVVVTNE